MRLNLHLSKYHIVGNHVSLLNCQLGFNDLINAFPPFTMNVICLCTLVTAISQTPNPDQTAPLGAVLSGFIVFACFHNKTILQRI